MYTKEEKAISEFLLDINCLNEVAPWINKFNIFNVLKIDSFEIRHSNMLAWLLNPNENHGLGDKVLLGLIKFITANLKKRTLSMHELCQLLNNRYSFSVLREYNNIDILLVSNENKMVICIENKVYSAEHDDQLSRYKNFVEKRYNGYKQFYLYLTLAGLPSSDPDVWTSISYAAMQNIIAVACQNSELSPEVKIFIDNYLDVIKGKIQADDPEIKKVCNEIYLKHKKALDLIYSYKSSEAELICLNLKDWLSENRDTGIDEKSLWVDEGWIRFKSSYLDELFPDESFPIIKKRKECSWKKDSVYYYQLQKVNDSYVLDLAFGYDFISLENQPKIDEFLEKMGKQCDPSSWGYKIYSFEQNEYAADTFLQGDFTKLMNNIKAEEEKMKRKNGKKK